MPMKKLSDFIKSQGLNQERVAKAAGYDPGTVSRHCNGKRRITGDAAIRYSRVLGVPLEDLFPAPVPTSPDSV